MTAALKPIRAFAVLERCENTGGGVFARQDIVARKLGACTYSDGDIANVECRRAHWADEFADTGVVPAKLAIAHNWRFECHGCGATINEDWLAEAGLELDGVIGSVNGRVFCCAECKQRHDDIETRKKLVGEEFLETLRAVVRRRLAALGMWRRLDRIWDRCKREAVERAAGI
ncbi:MAG: hypothetical protein DI528_22220 [Shinella sp.]|nr:MAG: hypothetical protein DI528_22220 [Shinella sp.]